MVREVSGDSHRFAPYLCVNIAATYFRENVVSEGTAVLDCQVKKRIPGKLSTTAAVISSFHYVIMISLLSTLVSLTWLPLTKRLLFALKIVMLD